jgi:hypothetical protein
MIRILLLALCLVFGAGSMLEAQHLQRPRNPDYPGQYNSKFLRRSSLMVTVGSGYVQDGWSQFGRIGLGEISYAYAINRDLDLGAGLYGSLLCNKAFYGENGQIRGTAADDPSGERCDRAWAFGSTLMALARYYPLEELPFYAQAALGYALDGQAPVALIGTGYSHRVVERIGITALVRYAAMIRTGATPDWVQPAGGLRLELGLLWHH